MEAAGSLFLDRFSSYRRTSCRQRAFSSKEIRAHSTGRKDVNEIEHLKAHFLPQQKRFNKGAVHGSSRGKAQ
jgi:hypothetical protein